MTYELTTSELPDPAARAFEVVERKGLGHPDSICDSLAESFSLAFSRFWLDRVGRILHHNLDKVLLSGGAAQPCFGGGTVTAPIEIVFSGRATCRFKGIDAPIEALADEITRKFFREHFPFLDPERHLSVRCRIRPGSEDLVDLFERSTDAGAALANDSSIGVGFAPLSRLEQSVLAVDQVLRSLETRQRYPAFGEDTKLLAVHFRGNVALTVACAFCDRYVASLADYFSQKEALSALVAHKFAEGTAVTVNAADNPSSGSIYLTVTGTSAEAGDDGEAGRGNRANGLITPCRPMSMESVAGKNPVSHTGKIYNLAAIAMARDIVREIPNTVAAECYLASRIGQPITSPQFMHVRVATRDSQPVSALDAAIAQIVHANLAKIGTLQTNLLNDALAIY